MQRSAVYSPHMEQVICHFVYFLSCQFEQAVEQTDLNSYLRRHDLRDVILNVQLGVVFLYQNPQESFHKKTDQRLNDRQAKRWLVYCWYQNTLKITRLLEIYYFRCLLSDPHNWGKWRYDHRSLKELHGRISSRSNKVFHVKIFGGTVYLCVWVMDLKYTIFCQMCLHQITGMAYVLLPVKYRGIIIQHGNKRVTGSRRFHGPLAQP